MDMHMRVFRERHLVAKRIKVRERTLRLADRNAARQQAAIGHDPVVGDFSVMVPAVEPDTTATLRTVGEGDAIDARWIAEEIASVSCGCAISSTVREQNGWRYSRIHHSLPKHGNSCAFIRSHECGFLQEFRDIGVKAGVPAENGFIRYRIYLLLHRRRTRVSARWIVRICGADGATVYCDAKEAVNLPAPGFHLTRRLGGRIDGDRVSPNTLQPNGLPHQQHFVVSARTHDDQVTRGGVIDRGLDSFVRGILPIDIGRSFATDGDGYSVDGLLAVAGSDDQLTATGSGSI